MKNNVLEREIERWFPLSNGERERDKERGARVGVEKKKRPSVRFYGQMDQR